MLLALPASARNSLKLEINDGRVTLDATSVPVRQILAEWARVGGTKVVGAEKITGAPLTLKLVDMPERQALDIILRNVAGYMAAPRRARQPGRLELRPHPDPGHQHGRPQRSQRAGRTPRRRPAPWRHRPTRAAASAGNARPADVEPDDPVEPDSDDQADPASRTAAGVHVPAAAAARQPGLRAGAAGRFRPSGSARRGQAPVIQLQPNANGQPTIYNFVPDHGRQPPPDRRLRRDRLADARA